MDDKENRLPIKNYAFISYSHHDMKMAKWLQKKLESYKLPTEIHNEFEDSRYLRPVFRDQDGLNTGVLGEELRKHLESSKYLIVICSPFSAQSVWVNDEIKAFISWGRWEYIIPFIVDGRPNSFDSEECFPKALSAYVKEHPDRELLGINQPEFGRENAAIRVISRMLGVEFDELWNRHERERRKKRIIWSLISPLVAFLLYFFIFPVSLTVHVIDDNHQLPFPSDAVLKVANAEYSLNILDTTITIHSVPGYYRFRTIPVSFSSTFYHPLSSHIRIGAGTTETTVLRIERDSTFAIYAGYVYDTDGKPIADATVQIDDSITNTDGKGYFRIEFSVDLQSEYKSIRIDKPGKRAIVRDDECPGNNMQYIMHDDI